MALALSFGGKRDGGVLLNLGCSESQLNLKEKEVDDLMKRSGEWSLEKTVSWFVTQKACARSFHSFWTI